MWKYRYSFELCHYGVKGMKWGVRRTPEQLGHASKKVDKSRKSTIIKTEKDLVNQKSSSLKKGIKKLSQQIQIHEDKIRNPAKYDPEWAMLSKQKQEGRIKHWKKELQAFQDSIDSRIYELKRRGE